MTKFIPLLQSALAQKFPTEDFRRWINPLTWDYDQAESRLKLLAPTIFHRKFMAGHLELLAELATRLGFPLQEITVESPEVTTGVGVTVTLRPAPCSRETPRYQPVSGAHSFERFLEGPSNRLARLATLDYASGQPAGASLLLLSPGPWGKTHLLDALTLKLGENRHRLFRRYNGADPSPLLMEALSWLDMELVIIDDVHLMATRPEFQECLSRAFDQAAIRPLGLILAAPEFPAGLNESLRSRLGGGLVLKIEPPEYELLLKLGLRRVQELCLEIPLEVLEMLAREANGDPRRLTGFLETLYFITNRTGLPLMEALSRLIPARSPDSSTAQVGVANIIEAVASTYGLKISDLTGQSRLKQAAWPRRVAMLLAREMTSLTTTQIGAAFGGRDHSTVIHALKKVHQELKSPGQTKIVETIKQSLLTGN